MATVVTRAAKGSPLTNTELDSNFSNLNTELGQKLHAANNLSDLPSALSARANLGLGTVENKSSATIRSEITSANVTAALGFTPYNNTNPSGYLSSITSAQVTAALGYTPPQPNGTGASGTWGINITGRGYPYRSDGTGINFNWSGQSGQPSWLWGSNDGVNMYVYNPSNFSVNYAVTAGSASYASSAAYASSAGNGGVSSVNGMTGAVTVAAGGAGAFVAFGSTGGY